MRKIIFNKTQEETINFKDVNEYAPIFAKFGEKLVGMLVKEGDKWWILRLGGSKSTAGRHDTLIDCIKASTPFGYTFFVSTKGENMKEIVLDSQQEKTIDFVYVNNCKPIFSKQNNKLIGMVIKEEKGWILRLGKGSVATGYHATLFECIKACTSYGYTFFVN